MLGVWMGIAAWNGPDDQLRELKIAVQHYCTCDPNMPTCPPHVMLANQETLNRLAYARTLRSKYMYEEYLVDEVDG